MRWLVFVLVLLTVGCTDLQRQVQIHTADAVAEGANSSLPMLVGQYDKEGRAAIAAAQTREEAEAGTAAVKEKWAPRWAAWETLVVAQDTWATALEDGGDLGAALAGVKKAYCELRLLWPGAIPAVPLVPVKCPEAAP